MQLFKSLLLTLLIVGTLNSCKKDDGGGDTDKTDNSDTTQPSYSVAAVNMPYDGYSYTLTKESNNLEVFTGKEDGNDFIGEIAYDAKGSPSGFYIGGDIILDMPIKTKDKLITEITLPEEWSQVNQSNYKLISKNDNTYTYGVETDYTKGEGDGSVELEGDIIRIFPEVDSIYVIHFVKKDYGGREETKYLDSFGITYSKKCKTSFSINYLNMLFYNFSRTEEWFLARFCISSILDNMGATYFTRGVEDDDGNHKDYKVTFNDNNLPVRVDGLVTRRIWTATYQ